MKFLTGELVTRASYDHDLLFRIKSLTEQYAIIQGVDMRLEADAPTDDLHRMEDQELENREADQKQKEAFSYRFLSESYQLMEEVHSYDVTDGYEKDVTYLHMPAIILHLDGDQIYLRKCIHLYKRLGLQVHGMYLDEKDMPHEVGDLITRIQPDIVVITGHDAYL